MTTLSMLWRRLDTPGHDACRLESHEDGWRLEGAAIFRHDGSPAHLTYRLACDPEWQTREGRIRGWLGSRSVDFAITRGSEGTWFLDGVEVAGLESLVDLDLGFTPATNLSQLRRVALAVGQEAEVPVAWFDVSAGRLEALPQRYERRAETAYWYESSTVGYAALLEVTAEGFVRHYPGLWEAEP